MSDPATPETSAEQPAAVLSAPAEPAAPEAPETTAAETPAVETTAAEPAPAPAAETPAAETEAPAEPPVAEPAKEAAAEAETPAETPAPTYEPFALPEGVVADTEAMGRFTEVIGDLGLDQAGGQRLMDLYAAEHERLANAMAEHQQRVFADTQKEWVTRFEQDPELGRNRRDTTLNQARTAIGWAFGLGIPGKELEPAAQTAAEARRQEFWDAMSYTGFGNHLASIRAWTQVHKMLAPYLAEAKAPPAGAPTKGEGLRAADRRYGNGG